MNNPSHFIHVLDQLRNFHKRPFDERNPFLLEELIEALDMDDEPCLDPASGALAGPVTNYVQAQQQLQYPRDPFIAEKVAESLAELNYAKAHMYRTTAELQTSRMAIDIDIQRHQLRFQVLQQLLQAEREDKSRRFESAVKVLNDPSFNTEEMAPVRQSAIQCISDYFDPKIPSVEWGGIVDKVMSMELK